jgi:hypothetical protein
MWVMNAPAGPAAGRPPMPGRPEPVLRTSPRCPTCGRQNVILFRPFFGAATDRVVPQLVCLACAPRPTAAS